MKSDRRVQYTRMVLEQSLLQLLRDRPIGKIRVNELCALADVNRGTFYAHYRDPYDLLAQIENRLFDQILREVKSAPPESSSIAQLLDICHALKENRDLCTVLFGPYGDHAFLERVVGIVRNTGLAQWHAALPNVDMALFERLYNFYAHGCLSVVEAWVREEFCTPPEELAVFLNAMNRGCLQAAATLAQPPSAASSL